MVPTPFYKYLFVQSLKSTKHRFALELQELKIV